MSQRNCSLTPKTEWIISSTCREISVGLRVIGVILFRCTACPGLVHLDGTVCRVAIPIMLLFLCGRLQGAFAQGTMSDSPSRTPVVALQFFDGDGCQSELSLRFKDGSTAEEQRRFVDSLGLKSGNLGSRR